jgi:hypothetical protein
LKLRATKAILPGKAEIEKDATQYRDGLRNQKTDADIGRRLFGELLSFTRDYPHAKSLIVVNRALDGGAGIRLVT